MEWDGVFRMYQYAYRKALRTYDAVLDIEFAEQAALDHEAVVQIDFSAAFYRVFHSDLLY